MTTKWTKGPWKAQLTEGWGWVVLAGKTFIAFKLRSEANAQLIASAPQLYERLAEMKKCLEDVANMRGGWDWELVIQEAEAALRQARGEDK